MNDAKNEKQGKTVETQVSITAPKFSKGQLLASNRFKERRDALNAVLEDDKSYTNAEAEKLLIDFMKGKVK